MELKDVQKPKLYSLSEVAQQTGISKPTLYRMVKQGKIPFVNVARTGRKPIYGFLATDIQDYFDTLSSPPARGENEH